MARLHPQHGADLDGWVILLDDARGSRPPAHLLRPFAMLNACRIIRSVAEDDVVQSKFGSAWWGLDHLPAEHHAAIRAALARYRGAATAQENAALARGRAAIMTLAARELGR
ncbi:MAG: aminoglycoside adenylyltransferase domain-containing protein [Streptosporangiaceae bacterium]|jgi:hypothetical protein